MSIEPARLVQGRELANLRQGELAHELDISQTRLSAYETGARLMPGQLHVAWVDAVGRSLDYLHGRVDVFRQVSSHSRKSKLVECKPSIRTGERVGDEVITLRSTVKGAPTILVTTPPTSEHDEDQW